MSAWGLAGGGPLNAQQVDRPSSPTSSRSRSRGRTATGPRSTTRTARPGTCPAEIQEQIETTARQAVEDGEYASYGEALFNLALSSGAYSCARCHTSGWSYGDPQEPGQGGLGPNITGGSENAHFPNSEEMIDFVSNGSENGVGYAEQGQGSGKMPAFGAMLTEEQIAAIVDYVRSL